MPPKTRGAVRKPRKKDKKNIALGQAHIKSTFNNTIVSITDPSGAVISWASSGEVGFASRAVHLFAAQMAAEAAAKRAQEHGMRKVDVFAMDRLGRPAPVVAACGRWPRGWLHPGRHPQRPQRLPGPGLAPLRSTLSACLPDRRRSARRGCH